MDNEKLLGIAFKLFSSLEAIENLGAQEKLSKILGGMGIKPEQIQMTTEFLQETLKDEDFDAQMEKRAIASFCEAAEEAIRLAEIAKGYQEMGAINLQIAEEFFHLEEEAGVAYEVGTKKTQRKAQ